MLLIPNRTAQQEQPLHSEPSFGFDNFNDTLQELPGFRLDAGPDGSAFVAAQGAQVLSWQAGDSIERLYLSPATGGMTRDGRKAVPIRGGVPVCFPQFSDRGAMVKHGFARDLPWRIGDPVQASVTMRLHDDDASRQYWPHAFEAQIDVRLGPGNLEIVFKVVNTGNGPFSFTTALHTYLRVDDIRRIQLFGLQNVAYQDATDGCTVKTQQEPGLAIPGEVDRVYMNALGPVRMVEQDRTLLTISQRGFFDTVVWNPGPDRAHMLADMPDEDWLHMLCVEAACASVPVTIEAGACWEGSQRLIVG
jgi:glucose-6-phosphate 1-epimerase